MDLESLQQHTTKEIERFESEIGTKENDEMIFLYLNKINDEISNLSSSVMAQNGYGESKGLHESFSDAVISIAMLAQKMKVNLPTVLQEKMKSMEMRINY